METTEVMPKIKWQFDIAHTQIAFKIKHLMFATIRGHFNDFDGSIYTTGEDFTTSEIDFWINPSSIDTGNEKRDTHLRSADFFDVEKFKEISFIADSFAFNEENGHYVLYGSLKMKDIKRQIRLDVVFTKIAKDQHATEKAVFTIIGKINRKDWGLNWNAALETGGVLVSEEVWIDCEVQLMQVKEHNT